MLASSPSAHARLRWVTRPLLLFAALLLVAGCGGSSSESTDSDGGSAPAASGDGSDAEPSKSDDVVASTEGQLGNGRARLDINGLRQRGEVLELHFTVTNVGEGRISEFGAFDSNEDKQLDTSVSAVYLVNPHARQRHLVLLDEAGECVCSEAPVSFEPDVPVRLNASFAAPEEPVETMTVAVPSFGSVSDVPVSNG